MGVRRSRIVLRCGCGSLTFSCTVFAGFCIFAALFPICRVRVGLGISTARRFRAGTAISTVCRFRAGIAISTVCLVCVASQNAPLAGNVSNSVRVSCLSLHCSVDVYGGPECAFCWCVMCPSSVVVFFLFTFQCCCLLPFIQGSRVVVFTFYFPESRVVVFTFLLSRAVVRLLFLGFQSSGFHLPTFQGPE